MYAIILVVCQLSSYVHFEGPTMPISGFRQCYLAASADITYSTIEECQSGVIELASAPEPEEERHFHFCADISGK